IIGYGEEFQSLVFNRGIRSAASATDNSDHNESGFTNLKCKKADKGKNIPLKGERDKNINYIADQGNSNDDSDNESESIRKKEPKGKKEKRSSKGADSDNESGKTYIPDWAKGTITEGTSISRALMDLGKLYVNPQDKFGAKHHEVLENKLRIFFKKC
ncbi:BgTH12-06863, partial [Blumeria graminis f. sp. triticale]